MSLSPSTSDHNQHDDTILSTETLDALKPYIHALVTITRLLRWKPYNNDKSSPTSIMILVITAWSTLFYHHQIVLSLVAPIFIFYLTTAQSTTTTNTTTTPTAEQRRHVNNDDDHVFVNELLELVQLLPTTTQSLKLYSKRQRDNVMMILMAYLAWVYVLYSERLGQVVWMIGCICFMWCSPWITQLRNIIYARRQAAIAASSSAQTMSSTAASQQHPKKPELDRLYCFCIYQHQRWWLHTGWSSSLMLPQDRPVWSDEYLEPTPSVDEFSLPPPIGDQCWVWTDPAWKIDNAFDNNTGWEYGSWDWDTCMHAITSLNTIAPPPPKNQQRPSSRVLNTTKGGGGGPPSPVESDGYRSRTTPASSDDHLSPMNIASSPARPISPQSLGTSPIVSRSNTFNTVSSKKSNSSSGTMRSSSDDQNNGSTMMSRTKTTSLFSKKGAYSNHHQPDMDGEATYSSATSSIYKNDWMTESNVSSSGSSFEDHSMEPGGSAVRKMSVASADPTVNQPDGFQAPEHEGWLHKQGDKYKTWNKRWFVLKGINLFYFKSPKDVRMKGIINLRGYRIIVDDSIHSSKYCFKAQHDRERTFYFYTDSQESMRKWVNVLMKTTIARDISSPVVSSNPVATVSLDVARRMRPRPPSMIMYNNGNGTTTVQTKNARPHTELMHNPKMTMLQEEEEYSQQQQMTTMDPHIEWVNLHLDQPINDLSTAFRDGERLVELLESLSGKQVRRPPPPEDGCQSDMYMLDTIVAAFKFMGREGVQVNGEFTIKDVFAGDVSKITKMLDAIQDWSAQ